MGGFILIAVLVWAVSMAAWMMLSNVSRKGDADRIKSRLLGTGKSKKKREDEPQRQLINREQDAGRLVAAMLKKYRLMERLQELIEQAGLKWTPARLIHGCLALFLGGFGLAWVMLPANFRQLSYVPGLALAAVPVLYAVQKRKSRLKRFEELFPETLEFVARSMRAGHAFSVSLEMIHREFQEPVSGEFRRTFEEHNLGLPLEVALQKLAKRVPSLDVHFFVSAVLLQKRTGGNLAEILDKLAYVIRERFKLRGRIRAVSAHGKMTGVALTCIPIGVAILMFFVNPDYVRFFFLDEVGNMMLGAAALLQLIGYGVIQKIVSIEV
jgi:tight adherence protein B